MDRQNYINRIVTRLKALLDAEPALPCKFEIVGGRTVQSDAPVSVYLEPQKPTEGVFETGPAFARLQKQLNEEFANDPLYFGIFIAVPHRFLGQQHLTQLENQRKQQDADNKQYRRIRLSDESPPQAPPS